MLMIRRTYLTSRLPPLSSKHCDQLKSISIGTFLQQTKRSCPKRNLILGENFCRFATRLNAYSSATLQERTDTNLLHQNYVNAVKRLDLIESETDGSPPDHIKLPSTGQLLSQSVNKSLSKWKQNARKEIRSLYKSDAINDDFVVETVRGINFSLIGWFLQTYGMQNAFALMQWLGVPLFESGTNYVLSQPEPPLLAEGNDETQRRLGQILDGYDALERKLNYNFHDKAFLLQAVTHESFTTNDITPDYRGLDFAGDAVLNYIIVRHVFRQPQCFDADELQNISSLLQGNSSLATVAVRNEFHSFLRYTAPDVRDNINSFVAFLRRNHFKPVDDFHFLDRNNFIFEVPHIIPSSFEALIGAVYFDSKMDLNVTSNTLLNLMKWDIQTILRTKPQSAYHQLDKLDSTAVFSEPVTEGSGQIRVTVTLPKFQNKRFNGTSRSTQLAKWGAAKSAVIYLTKKQNAFATPTKHRDIYQHYQNLQ